MEQIVPGSVVEVGEKERIRAVVCSIRPKRVEVVYLDAVGKALHQEVEWHNGAWEFISGVYGGRPADKDTRLVQYVTMLRNQH